VWLSGLTVGVTVNLLEMLRPFFAAKTVIKLEDKKISREDFYKMLEEDKKEKEKK